MKKVLFCLSLIFGLLVLNQVPSFAMEFTFETIGGLGDLGYGLIGGATLDFNGTQYVIEDYDNLSEVLKAQAAEQKAREFLQAYCMARGIPIPNIDPDLPASTGKEFYKSQYFDSANRTVWNNYKLGRTSIEQQDALRFPISPQAFNDWTGYSEFWYEKYMNMSIGNTDEDDGPSIPDDIPATSQAYISTINGNDAYKFFWKDSNKVIAYPQSPTDRFYYFNSDFSDRSWFYYSSNNFNTLNYPSSLRISGNYLYGSNDILTLNIVSNESTYTATMNNITNGNLGYFGDNVGTNFYYFTALSDLTCSSLNNISDLTIARNAPSVSTTITRTSASIDGLLEWFSLRFRNININVDGIPWAIAGDAIDNAPADPIIPTFPDVIGGDSEDPIPAYDIVFPNTSDYEGTFDITSLFDALKEAIIGASDSDSTTDGTLTKEKVSDTFKDKVGEAVGEATKTIDDVMEDSFPVQGTLNYPNLPPIPQIPLDNAFAGTTILSELIDACQQILPSPLALAFWGMIFILFIIGLIRILHK